MRPLPPGALRRLAAALPRLAATLTAACFLVSTAQANCEVIGDSTCKDGHYCEGGIYDSCEPCPHSNCKDCGTGRCKHGRNRNKCKDCGTGQCQHKLWKNRCKDCANRQ